MLQHHQRHPSDTLDDGSGLFYDSTLSHPSESYALLPTSSPHPVEHSHLGPPHVEKQQKFSWRRRCRHMSPYYVTPFIVLVLQTMLLILSWTFFAITTSRPLPLPVKNAIEVRLHMQTVTLVVTLIASIISSLSVILYASAIRYALARFLASDVSLYAVFAASKIANSSPIMNFTRPSWTIVSILCVLAINIQTAGYTTLLTPKRIVVKSNMIGYELDLKSFDFQKLMEQNAELVTSDMFSRALPLTAASGGTAVSTRFSLPSILNFNHFSFLNSTRGILPVIIDEVESKVLSEARSGTTMPVNVNIEQKRATTPGFPVSFSMSQQGFSAQVTCQQRALGANTRPSLVLRSQDDRLISNRTVTLAQLEVVCSNDQSFCTEPILTSANVDAFFAVSCPVTETNGRRSWDLILTGSGRYNKIKTTICSIYPQVHALTIDYNDNTKLFNSSFPNFINGTELLGGEDAPWLGDFALSVFLSGLNVGQSTTGNAMGDTILSFMSTLPTGTNVLSDVLGHYVRGVLELSVTLLRTVYTQNDNGLYPGGTSVIPPNMRIAINGSYSATTVGWHQSSETSAGPLVAPTFISLISIATIVAALLAKGRNKEPDSNRYFDPGDILHVISAASAGGLQTRFPPFHETKVAHFENVMITLGPVKEGDSRSGFITDLNQRSEGVSLADMTNTSRLHADDR